MALTRPMPPDASAQITSYLRPPSPDRAPTFDTPATITARVPAGERKRPAGSGRDVPLIWLDSHMNECVYTWRGICVRHRRRAEPAGHLEPAGVVGALRRRDRAPPAHAADLGLQAPARAARGRVRGSHSGRAAPSLPAETGTASRGGFLAGPVPPVLVRARGCARAPPRPHGSINPNEAA